MKEKDIKIDPKLLKNLMETLNLISDNKRSEYLDNLISNIDLTIDKAHQLQIEKNIDFETALKEILV